MDIRLDGQVAVVTGASRGIGLAIARAMVDSGAQVLLVARREAELEAAAADLGPAARWLAGNAGDPEVARRAVARCCEELGRLDVLVNNAATNPYYGPTLGIDEAAFDKTVALNWKAPLAWAREAWTAWMRDHGGSILNVSSAGALTVESGIGVYNGTKAALLHLTRTLAVELAPGVRVNAIAPGLVRTRMSRALWEGQEEEASRATPLGRLGEPADVAGCAVFLSSDQASWITGQTISVDGGILLGR
ncbi:MAG: SDR family oxidoreductase [Acidimicrobiia bacterium]